MDGRKEGGERVRPEEDPQAAGHGGERIENRGQEKGERQQVPEQVAHVAEVHRKRGDDESEAERRRREEQEDDGKLQRRGSGPDGAENRGDGDGARENGERENEVREPRGHGDGGEHLRRDSRLPEERAVGAERLRGVGERGRHEAPAEDAAEEEESIRPHVGARREDDPEDGRVDEQQEERVQEGPQESERAAAIPGEELATRERDDERTLPPDSLVGREQARQVSDILRRVSSADPGAAPSPAPAVVCERVSKTYPGAQPVLALDSVDLTVPSGQFLAVVGPSGGGKSTLLHLVAGIDAPTSGSIRVGGRDVALLSDRERTLYRRRDVGVVFQFFNLLPHLTVEENVEMPRLLDGRTDARERAADLLERVDLAHRRAAHPYELSGGEMQRAAIARALVTGARLLLADEPTGNLDSRHGAEVLALLDAVRQERGVTLILATHSEAAAQRADRVVRIVDGRLA